MPFYFKAIKCPANEVASAIGEHFGCSVLLQPSDAEKTVTAVLRTSSLVQTLDAFAFLLGGNYRRLDSTNGAEVFLVGGKAIESVQVFDSYGLTAAEIGGSVGQGVQVLDDKIVADTDEQRGQQIGDLLQKFRHRPAITLEVWELAVSDLGNEYVNAWLQNFAVGATLHYPVTAVSSNALTGYTSVSGPSPAPFQWTSDIQVLFQLLQSAGGVRQELHEKMQCVSGTRSEFDSGDVVSDVTYATVENTSGQLASTIERRTVGLTLSLLAVNADLTNWFLSINFTDGSINGATETKTSYSGEREIADGQGFFLLGAFTRRGVNFTESKVPILSAIPWAGPKFFTTSTRSKTKDNVVIIARPCPNFPGTNDFETVTNYVSPN